MKNMVWSTKGPIGMRRWMRDWYAGMKCGSFRCSAVDGYFQGPRTLFCMTFTPVRGSMKMCLPIPTGLANIGLLFCIITAMRRPPDGSKNRSLFLALAKVRGAGLTEHRLPMRWLCLMRTIATLYFGIRPKGWNIFAQVENFVNRGFISSLGSISFTCSWISGKFTMTRTEHGNSCILN